MSKVAYTDLEFIEGLKHNNDAVLRVLYKKYYNIVLKYVVNNSGNSEVDAEVYKETSIVVYENAQKPEFQLNCQLQTFIFSIAKPLWLKQLRNNGQITRFKDDEEEDVVNVTEEVTEHLKKES